MSYLSILLFFVSASSQSKIGLTTLDWTLSWDILNENNEPINATFEGIYKKTNID